MTWREHVLHNLGLKIASLGLASLLWYAVHGRYDSPGSSLTNPSGKTIVKDYVRLPITITQSPGAAHLFQVQPPEVSVRLSGDQIVLQELRGSDLEVFVNLTDADDRPTTARRVKVLAPSGVRILRVEPALVHIERLPNPAPPSLDPSPPSLGPSPSP